MNCKISHHSRPIMSLYLIWFKKKEVPHVEFSDERLVEDLEGQAAWHWPAS